MTSSKTDRLYSNNTKSDRPGSDKPYIIITIPMIPSNSYLIVSGGKGILVDGGSMGKIKNFQTSLKKTSSDSQI